MYQSSLPTPTSSRTAAPPAPASLYDVCHHAVSPPFVDGNADRLAGLTILHVSDPHIRRWAVRSAGWKRIERACSTPVDIVAITGDLMDHPRDMGRAAHMLSGLAGRFNARLGVFGIFGNHDSPRGRDVLRAVPGIRWLGPKEPEGSCVLVRTAPISDTDDILTTQNWWHCYPRSGHSAVRDSCVVRTGTRGEIPVAPVKTQRITSSQRISDARADSGPTLLIAGDSYPEDILAVRAEVDAVEKSLIPKSRPFRLLLTHYPTRVYAASSLGFDFVLAGHTHGGQIRPLPGLVAHASCDLPNTRASGIIRVGDTLCAITRGIGEGHLPVRMFCPRQLPIYTLGAGAMASAPRRAFGRTRRHQHSIEQVVRW